MSSLYVITGELLELQRLLEAGEIDQQIFNDTLEGMDGSLEKKLQSCIYVMRNAAAEGEKFKAEEKFFAEKRKSAEKLAEGMEGMIRGAMLALNMPKVQTERFTLTVSGAGARPVVVYDLELLDAEYIKIEKSPDKKAIKAALDAGKEVKGATLGEQTVTLKVK